MASSTRSYTWPAIAAVVGLYLLLTALPDSWKGWAPAFVKPELHLGLDLQGGTQLDFRISEAEMEKQILDIEQDIAQLEAANAGQEVIDDRKAQVSNIKFQRATIVESIRNVLERRINSMGVSEAVITPSYYGEEKHLLVECPGVIDIQECIRTVGKTILLEFKEQFEGEDKENEQKMRDLAAGAYARHTESGITLATLGEDLGTTLGATYTEDSFYEDQLPEGLSFLWNIDAEDGVVYREIELDPVELPDGPLPHRGMLLAEVTGDLFTEERTIQNPEEAIPFLAENESNATLVTRENVSFDDLDTGYSEQIDQLLPRVLIAGERSDGAKTILFVTERNNPVEEIAASHILIAYSGAARADADVTRSKEDALAFANELKGRIDEGASFEVLARQNSDGPSAADSGNLGTFGRGVMASAFEQAAFALEERQISDPVETEFGYHLIRLDKAASSTEGTMSYLELVVSGEDAEIVREDWIQKLRNREIVREEEKLPMRTLFFSFLPTGWKDTPLDGKHFRRATVTTDPLTGIPVVQIVFDDEGGEIFHDLTERNIGKPIAIFVGGELVSAPTVQSAIPGGVAIITGSQNFDEANALAQDLNTGAIPAPIHLVGQSTVEATLGQEALRTSITAALWGFLLVGIYMIWYYRILGVIAALALGSYAVIFIALLKLPLFLFTDQYVVLTLAGMAGIILSIGMAVDANVLIFERMREELRKGKMLSTAASTGFKRAWTSIRDSNISTLITACILFIIGTSIVRGFAVTLSLGILISMFSAIVVTRFLISLLFKSPIAENPEAFGVKKK